MPSESEVSTPFAGDLFLKLAAEGRLVMDPVLVDETVAGLEQTLRVLRTRLDLLQRWQGGPDRHVADLPAAASHEIVGVVFAEQLNPGRLERAMSELPKYVEALRLAGGHRRADQPALRRGTPAG